MLKTSNLHKSNNYRKLLVCTYIVFSIVSELISGIHLEKADLSLASVLTATDKDKSEVRNSTKTLSIHLAVSTHPLLMPCCVLSFKVCIELHTNVMAP